MLCLWEIVQRIKTFEALALIRSTRGLAKLVADFRVLGKEGGLRSLLFVLIARLINKSSDAEQCDCDNSENEHVCFGAHAPLQEVVRLRVGVLIDAPKDQ